MFIHIKHSSSERNIFVEAQGVASPETALVQCDSVNLAVSQKRKFKAIIMRRVKVAVIGAAEAELCGGVAVAVEPGPVARDDGASAGGFEEEEVSVTLTLSFWPLLQ